MKLSNNFVDVAVMKDAGYIRASAAVGSDEDDGVVVVFEEGTTSIDR